MEGDPDLVTTNVVETVLRSEEDDAGLSPMDFSLNISSLLAFKNAPLPA